MTSARDDLCTKLFLSFMCGGSKCEFFVMISSFFSVCVSGVLFVLRALAGGLALRGCWKVRKGRLPVRARDGCTSRRCVGGTFRKSQSCQTKAKQTLEGLAQTFLRDNLASIARGQR